MSRNGEAFRGSADAQAFPSALSPTGRSLTNAARPVRARERVFIAHSSTRPKLAEKREVPKKTLELELWINA